MEFSMSVIRLFCFLTFLYNMQKINLMKIQIVNLGELNREFGEVKS